MGKGEVAHNYQFLLFPQCFYSFGEFLPFSSNLKLLSSNAVWKFEIVVFKLSLEESKICHWERVKKLGLCGKWLTQQHCTLQLILPDKQIVDCGKWLTQQHCTLQLILPDKQIVDSGKWLTQQHCTLQLILPDKQIVDCGKWLTQQHCTLTCIAWQTNCRLW